MIVAQYHAGVAAQRRRRRRQMLWVAGQYTQLRIHVFTLLFEYQQKDM
jgi:hypothetical protein